MPEDIVKNCLCQTDDLVLLGVKINIMGRHMLAPDEAAERFWRRVDRSGGPNACWPWIWRNGGGQKSKYGSYRYQAKRWDAHRLAYFLRYGKPAEHWHLHKCGNTLCCNPKHIYDGTPKQNSEDRDRQAAEQGILLPHLNKANNGKFQPTAKL